MTNLPTLLRKLAELHRQQHELEAEISDVEKRIVDGANEPKPRIRSTKSEMIDLIRDLVNVLHTAGKPLPRAEIASRLGVKPAQVNYKLRKACGMKFVERLEHGFYRATATVTAI